MNFDLIYFPVYLLVSIILNVYGLLKSAKVLKTYEDENIGTLPKQIVGLSLLGIALTVMGLFTSQYQYFIISVIFTVTMVISKPYLTKTHVRIWSVLEILFSTFIVYNHFFLNYQLINF